MNFFVIILLWQDILYLCTLFLVQGGNDMLPQQYYNEKVHIFNT